MLNHLQKAFDLDPTVHSRVVSIEEKKPEEKIALDIALRILLIEHNYFYYKESFQTEEAFEAWKDFARHDLLHCLSGFQNLRNRPLMASAQDFLNDLRRTSFVGKFIMDGMPCPSSSFSPLF